MLDINDMVRGEGGYRPLPSTGSSFAFSTQTSTTNRPEKRNKTALHLIMVLGFAFKSKVKPRRSLAITKESIFSKESKKLTYEH